MNDLIPEQTENASSDLVSEALQDNISNVFSVLSSAGTVLGKGCGVDSTSVDKLISGAMRITKAVARCSEAIRSISDTTRDNTRLPEAFNSFLIEIIANRREINIELSTILDTFNSIILPDDTGWKGKWTYAQRMEKFDSFKSAIEIARGRFNALFEFAIENANIEDESTIHAFLAQFPTSRNI